MEDELVEIQIDTLVLLEPPQPEDTLTAFEHVMERGALVAVTNCEDFNYKMYHAHPSGFDSFIDEANRGTGMKASSRLKFYLKFILPVMILIVFIAGLIPKS